MEIRAIHVVAAVATIAAGVMVGAYFADRAYWGPTGGTFFQDMSAGLEGK